MPPSKMKTYCYCKSNCLGYLCLLAPWITMGSSHKFYTSPNMTWRSNCIPPKLTRKKPACNFFLLSNCKSFWGCTMRSLNHQSGFLRMTRVSLNELTLLGFTLAHVLNELLKDITLLPPWNRSNTMIGMS